MGSPWQLAMELVMELFMYLFYNLSWIDQLEGQKRILSHVLCMQALNL